MPQLVEYDEDRRVEELWRKRREWFDKKVELEKIEIQTKSTSEERVGKSQQDADVKDIKITVDYGGKYQGAKVFEPNPAYYENVVVRDYSNLKNQFLSNE